MALRTDKGCATPQEAARKQVHQRLVQLFAPIVYFEPEEEFFPVDLPSTIQNSSLWLYDPKAQPPTQEVNPVGTINPTVHLPAATGHHYTTVDGTSSIIKNVNGKPPFTLPAPDRNKVLTKYTDGTIPAELTIYGTVCTASEVPNKHLLEHVTMRDKEVADAISGEGLIVNYYMYFPFRESPEFWSEGDWSGISLLLRETPERPEDLNTAQQLEKFLPVIACYYRKTIDGAPPSPYFVAGTHGFRRWKNVTRVTEQSVGLDTHPIVYISRGRHNCYYEPITTNIPLSPPWELLFKPDKIESGGYTTGPASKTLTGGGVEDIPWWAYVLFPPLAVLVACGTGCEYPVHFDSSGLPSGYEEGEEQAKDGGYNGLPGTTGSSHPKKPAGKVPGPSRQLSLRLRYVDLDDSTTTALWGYPGAWGGATLLMAKPAWDPQNPKEWGYYQGARRPALAAWFLWNLFLDSTFGSAGIPPLTPSP